MSPHSLALGWGVLPCSVPEGRSVALEPRLPLPSSPQESRRDRGPAAAAQAPARPALPRLASETTVGPSRGPPGPPELRAEEPGARRAIQAGCHLTVWGLAEGPRWATLAPLSCLPGCGPGVFGTLTPAAPPRADPSPSEALLACHAAGARPGSSTLPAGLPGATHVCGSTVQSRPRLATAGPGGRRGAGAPQDPAPLVRLVLLAGALAG